jgi:hypothetical protein
MYDEPGPDVPIEATLRVTKYAVELTRSADTCVTIRNLMADISGRLELFDADTTSTTREGTGDHSTVEIRRTLPAWTAQWRVRVTQASGGEREADAYLVHCPKGTERCSVMAQREVTDAGALLVVNDPPAGEWMIVVRGRGRGTIGSAWSNPSYRVAEAQLFQASVPVESSDQPIASRGRRSVSIPQTKKAAYAAFRIAGGAANTPLGLRIAVTGLGKNLP